MVPAGGIWERMGLGMTCTGTDGPRAVKHECGLIGDGNGYGHAGHGTQGMRMEMTKLMMMKGIRDVGL
jgi:hypothetical protein